MAARVYLAGPEVFLAEALEVAREKKAICAEQGFEGVFPLDNALDLEGMAPADQGVAIYRANRALMDSCDLLIANLTPFRGPSADAGTVFELGYMRGLGRPVFAYSNVAEDFAARTRAFLGKELKARKADGEPADRHGMALEDFALADNLMLDGAVRDVCDGVVVKAVPAKRRFTDLAGFRDCIALAAEIREHL